MAVYIFMIVSCLVTQYICDHTKRYKKIWGLLPITIIFFISALRYNVGTDYSGTYLGSYYKIMRGIDTNLEFVPTLFFKLIVKLGLDSQWFFVITSFIFCYFLYMCISDQATNKMLSYFIAICGAFLFFAYNGIRQAMAMIIFYYSLKWIIYNENNLRYWTDNVIAVGCHSSAAVFLPFNLFLKRRFKIKSKVALIAIAFVLSKVAVPFIVSIIIKTKYIFYINNAEMFSKSSLNLSNYINILFLFLYEYILFRNKDITAQDIVYDNIHFIGVIVSLFVLSIPLTYRLFYAFRYIEFLSVPNLLRHCSKKYRKLVTILVYVFYFGYFVYMILIQHAHDSLPYMTVFDR